MLKLALFAVAATFAVPAAAGQVQIPAAAGQADPAPAAAPAPAAGPMSAEDMARDPRMIAAIRHANVMADHKCGENVGGITDLALKAEAQRCRRRMIATAKLDAQGEIEGH